MRLRVSIPRLGARRILLIVAVAFSGFQFYDPSAHSFVPPVCMLAALCLLPDLVRSLKIIVKWQPTLLLGGIVFAYLLSLAWSVDDQLGTRTIIYVIMFLTIFSAGLAEARRDPKFIRDLILWTLAIGLLQVAIIFTFRAHPSLKINFFKSFYAGLFINPDMLTALFTAGGADNVLDPTKSGGLFVNANVAGAYVGFLAATSFGFAWAYRRTLWFFAAGIFLAGAYATGSKAAIVLCLGLAFVMTLAFLLKGRRNARWIAMIVLTAAPLALLAAYLFDLVSVGSSGASFGDQAAATFEIRTVIWGYAAQVFPQTPILGQGFGGWQLGFTPYASALGIPPNFPPHNLLIYMWSQGGLAALVLAVAFIVAMLGFSGRNLFSRDAELFGLSFALTFGQLWLILQAMGENYSIVGEEHMEPVLALLCAFAFARFAAARVDVPRAVAPARGQAQTV